MSWTANLVSAAPLSDPVARWEWLTVQAIFYGLAAGVGAWWSHRANGGPAGIDFTSRLLAIWWVLGIRFLVVLIIPIFALYAILSPGEDGHSHVADIISAFVFTIPYYWRAAVHLRDVTQAAAAGIGGGTAGHQGAAA